MKKTVLIILVIFAHMVFALEPAQILVIANSDVNESVQLAQYYCKARAVPVENILTIPLGSNLPEVISRKSYDDKIANIVRNELSKRRDGEIKCLLTIYGVPLKIGSAGAIENSQKLIPKLAELLEAKDKQFRDTFERLSRLGRQEMIVFDSNKVESFDDTAKHLPDDIKQAAKRIEYVDRPDERKQQYNDLIRDIQLLYGPGYAQKQAEELSETSFNLSRGERNKLNENAVILQKAQQQNWPVSQKIEQEFYKALESISGLVGVVTNLKADISRCKGEETSASVDSELSMVMYENYDLYRWQKNDLQNMPLWLPSKTLMVSRLDGPSPQIAVGLIDKAIQAEKTGLSGKAYIDARGLPVTQKPIPYSFKYYDLSLLRLAEFIKQKILLKVVLDKNEALFKPGSCPDTAIYCGWYSVKKYIDAFDFVPGAVGFHIASFEAMDLRNAASSNWCPAMLVDGVTATLGAVNEPYLHSFPEPDKFFAELFEGKCLVEAFYRTKPFNSWQLILIGDPLYKLNIRP